MAEEEEEAVPTGQVMLDFVILPEQYGQTKAFDIQLTVGAIQQDLEKELQIPEGSLNLSNMTGVVQIEGVLDASKCLYELGLNANDKVGIELRINYYEEQPAADYVMPDVLEIKCVDGDGKLKKVSVYVERPQEPKPFLGGYRHKQTTVEYHHCFTQTPRPRMEAKCVTYHREVQTYEYRTRSTQAAREQSTQAARAGLYLSCDTDKVLEARPYFSSADLAALKLEKVVILQCHVRGMFARTRARQLRKERTEWQAYQEHDAERQRLEQELRHKREIERRMHPRTFEDFEVLYTELEAWRRNETQRIHASNFDDASKQAALRQLLHKETKLLQTVDRLKIQAHDVNRSAKIKQMLEQMAKPKVWAQTDGEVTTVHTPFTTRSKELMDLYNGLRLPLLSIDERLDVLLHVKWTVKEFDCNLTREIVDLVDREADMLNRGRPEKAFVGCRKRLANLFLQFLETPEFNPEAMRFQKVPRELYQQSAVQPLSTVPIKGIAA